MKTNEIINFNQSINTCKFEFENVVNFINNSYKNYKCNAIKTIDSCKLFFFVIDRAKEYLCALNLPFDKDEIPKVELCINFMVTFKQSKICLTYSEMLMDDLQWKDYLNSYKIKKSEIK